MNNCGPLYRVASTDLFGLWWPELEKELTMTRMVEVTQEDANNYCRVLTVLGLEEGGDPVAEIERLKADLAAKDARINGIIAGNRQREAELRTYVGR